MENKNLRNPTSQAIIMFEASDVPHKDVVFFMFYAIVVNPKRVYSTERLLKHVLTSLSTEVGGRH